MVYMMKKLLVLGLLFSAFSVYASAETDKLPFTKAGEAEVETESELPFRKAGSASSGIVDSKGETQDKVKGLAEQLSDVKSSIKSDMLKRIRDKQEKLAGKDEVVLQEGTSKVNIDKSKVEKVKTIANYEMIKNAEGSVTIPVMPDHDGVVRINGSKPGTYVVQIAKGYLNLIDLPFVEPVADTINDVNITVKESGMYIYTNSEGSAGVWIYDKQNPNLSISLVFIPQNIAPRKIEVWYPDDVLYADYSPNPVPPTERVKALDLTKAKDWEAKSVSYVDTLVSLVDTISSNEIPPGYRFTQINTPSVGLVCDEDNLVGSKMQVLEGNAFKVDVYQVENTGRYSIEVDESRCYSRGVSAISVFPSVHVPAGEKYEMYVVYAKTQKTKARKIKEGARPSLVGGDDVE